MSLPLGDLLPLAVGIAISPLPIIAVILMLFTPKARVNGSAFAIGWVLGLLGVAVAVIALSGALDMGTSSEPSTMASLLKFVLGLLLLFGCLSIGRAVRPVRVLGGCAASASPDFRFLPRRDRGGAPAMAG